MATGALTIKLRCASWQQLATVYKRDLSRGTMFLKAASPPAIGTSVRIDLTLPSASVVVLTGVVEQHVNDPQRGAGVELKLAPIPAGSVWMIESALASEASKRANTAVSGVPQIVPTQASGPVAALGEGEGHQLSDAELELVRALVAEAESLRKLNPFLVLGIGYEASDADVRAAFGELTKRYHPDRFARYQSTELRQVAAEIFILIRDAYRRVGDEQGRAHTLAGLGRGATASRAMAPGRSATPASGVSRIPLKPPAAQVPPLVKPAPTGPVPRPTAPTPPRPIQATPPPTFNDHTTKKPEPLPPTSAGNDLPTKRPQPLPGSEARAAAAASGGADDRRPSTAAPAGADGTDHGALDEMLDHGRYPEALAAYRLLAKKHPGDRSARAGIELCEGLTALAGRDRLEAAQRFEAALEIDPSNERAARELADMRRQATNERKGLLSRLMGKKE